LKIGERGQVVGGRERDFHSFVVSVAHGASLEKTFYKQPTTNN
jgi:hypothetical protein